MMGKKLKLALALGAMAATFLAAGCGDDKGKQDNGKAASGIPAVIRVGSETTFPPFEFTKDDKYVGFDLDLADAVIKQMESWKSTDWHSISRITTSSTPGIRR